MSRSLHKPLRLSLAFANRSHKRSKWKHAGSRGKFDTAGLRNDRSFARSVWKKLRAPLQVVTALAVLVGINFYLIYYRNGTSLPALLQQAETGRALSAKLSGPLGTPPQPQRPHRKPKPLPPLPDYPRVLEVSLHVGDALPEILSRVPVPPQKRGELATAIQTVVDPGGFGPGQTLTFFFDFEDKLQAVDYRLTPSLAYHFERVQTGSLDRFVPEKQTQPLTVSSERIEVAIQGKGDVQAAFARASETPALAARAYEVLACEMNLYADAQKGDKVRILVEKVLIGNRFYRYGRLLAMEYLPSSASRKSRVRVFLRSDGSPANAGAALGSAQLYFSDRGESASKIVCRAPLVVSRMQHPNDTRPSLSRSERGRTFSEYPTEAGALVVSVASGKIKILPSRPGKPLTVVVSHAAGLETSLFPIGKLARGLTDGQIVKARQLIGYVAKGEGGDSVRLRLSARQNGRSVDLAKVRSNREPGISEDERAAFLETSSDWAERLARDSNPVEPVFANQTLGAL